MRLSTGESLRLDDLDHQIIALLAQNARASYATIGDEVGLSAPAVKRRVDRLLEVGALKGFTVVLDPDLLGTTTDVFVELWGRGRTSPADLASVASAHPEVIAAYTVAGEADAILHVRTRDMAAFEQVLERLRADDRVERTRSVIVLSCILERPPAMPTP